MDPDLVAALSAVITVVLMKYLPNRVSNRPKGKDIFPKDS